MENINNSKNIYDLMKSDGGAKIFNYYGIETATKQNQKNPFAQKTNKKKTSVFLTNFGMYYFKEWNTGIEGTAFDFIQEYEGLDKEATAEKILAIYGQSLVYSNFNINPKYNKKNKIEITILKPSELRKTDILKLDSNFHHYFRNNFNINDEHFLRWGIGTNQNKETCFALQNTEKVIINFKYVNYNLLAKRNKDTTPYSLSKKTDTYGNTTGKFEMCLFGEHLLNIAPITEKQSIIILVESEKTAFLASYFYPEYEWLSTGSANGLTNEKIDNIAPFLKNKRIIWLCDADDTGRKASSIKNLRNKNLQVEVIDLFPEFGTGTNPINKGYDLADYIINNKENYNEGKKLDILSDGFAIDKYISELWENNLGFKNLITKDNLKLIIQSGTGTGKTTFSEELGLIWHQKNNFPTIIAVPLNAIAQNKHETSKVKCEKNELSLHESIPYFITSSFNKKNIESTLYELTNAKVMYCNFDITPKITEKLTQMFGGYNMIIDEQHTLITDAQFRNKIVKQVKKCADDAKMTLMFSGTVVNIGMENYQYINIPIKKQLPRKINAYELKSDKQIMVCLVNNLINTNNKCIVLYNSSNQLMQLQKILASKGKKSIIIQSEEELLYNPAYKSIMEDCKYPDEFDVLLCTSVVATGVDIISDNLIEMHYVNQQFGYDCTLSQQFMARIRKQENGLFFSYSKNNQYAKDNYQSDKYFKKTLQELNAQKKKFKQEKNQALLELNKKSPIKTNYDELLEFYCGDKEGNIQVDILKVANKIHQQKIIYSSVHQLKNNIVLNLISFDFENKATLIKELKENKEIFKMLKEKEEQKAYHFFIHEKENYANALWSCTQDRELKTFIEEHYPAKEKVLPQDYFDILEKQNYYLQLQTAENLFLNVMKCYNLGILDEDITVFLFTDKKTFVSKNKITEQLNTLKLLCFRQLKKEAANNSDLWKSLAQDNENFFEASGELLNKQIEQHEKIQQVIQKEFELNKNQMTNEQIQEVINRCRVILLSKNKAVRYAKSLFHLVSKVSTINKKTNEKVRYYVFNGLKTLENICVESNISCLSQQNIIKNQFAYLMRCKVLQNNNEIFLEKGTIEKCSTFFQDWYNENENEKLYGNFEDLSQKLFNQLENEFKLEVWLQNNPCPF